MSHGKASRLGREVGSIICVRDRATFVRIGALVVEGGSRLHERHRDGDE